jgi:hypothetical protein
MEQVNMSKQAKKSKTNPVKAMRDVARLSARVRELEDEVRECRQHHQRLAELTDVVTELLLPLSRRDQDKVDEILTRYTEQLG